MEFEDEYSWLGRYVLRLRPILRYVMDPRADRRLRELVVEAEERLEQLDESRRTKAPIGEREMIAEKDPEKNSNSWDPEKVHEFRRILETDNIAPVDNATFVKRLADIIQRSTTGKSKKRRRNDD